MTQPTSGSNCVEDSRPQRWLPDIRFFGKSAMRTRWVVALLLTKAGDIETNPGPTTSNK